MHRFANSPVMRKIEDQIREAVDKHGDTIEYTVTPIYRTNDPTDVIPLPLTIETAAAGASPSPHTKAAANQTSSLL